jgi:phosphoribosylaminoimidazole carboxylase (NCAIR synthetase)
VILPGAVLGVMGGGQLGAMFAMAAQRMGYRVEVISDSEDCPSAHHADRAESVRGAKAWSLIVEPPHRCGGPRRRLGHVGE